jgi:hypothetical protein
MHDFENAEDQLAQNGAEPLDGSGLENEPEDGGIVPSPEEMEGRKQ